MDDTSLAITSNIWKLPKKGNEKKENPRVSEGV